MHSHRTASAGQRSPQHIRGPDRFRRHEESGGEREQQATSLSEECDHDKVDPAGQQSAAEVDDAVTDRGSQREEESHPLRLPGTAGSIRELDAAVRRHSRQEKAAPGRTK